MRKYIFIGIIIGIGLTLGFAFSQNKCGVDIDKAISSGGITIDK